MRHKTKWMGNGQYGYVHRDVWEKANGPIPDGMFIDHINGDPTDNRLENLRLATCSQNNMNMRRRKDNTSGVKGLYWHTRKDRPNGRWGASVTANGQTHKFFSSNMLDAVAWLYRTRAELHGEYARFD